MKKYAIFFTLLVIGFMTMAFMHDDSVKSLVNRDISLSKTKGIPLAVGPVAVIAGDSIYLSSIDFRGTWTITTPPVQMWPWQGLKFLKDTLDENPLSRLDYTDIVFDTTWGVTSLGTAGKYAISKTITQSFANGRYTLATGKGFMTPNRKYFVEVYTVSGTTSTLTKTLGFDPASGDTAFGTATFTASYVAEGRGVYPAGTPARPDSLISATAYSRVRFQGGKATKGFAVPVGTDSLRLVLKADQQVIARYSVPVSVVNSNQLGVQAALQIATPTPSTGYFKAGDSIDVNFNLTDIGNNPINWWTNPLNTGISRIELLVSGPKRDYERVFALRNVVNSYTLQYDSVRRQIYNGNPIRIVLPANLPNGNGTYTIFMNVTRVFGSSTSLAVLKDFQVGVTAVDSLPVSSAVGGRSCASCHGVAGPTGHHGAKGAEQCLTCHVDNMPGYPQYAFSEFVHVFHQTSAEVQMPLGKCSTCHNNGSENQFTSDANKVCTSCHGMVPYMPTDHSVVPLYAPTGMSCATANCHVGGNMGVFKNITETHENLATKYADKEILAKKTLTAPVIDGQVDALWKTADSITTQTGIKMKFVYDTTYLYVFTTWKDAGHKLYGGGAGTVVPPTKSLSRNKWSYDGTNWTKTGSEDRISFVWKMNDPLGASCARTCHDVGTGHLTESAKMDNWHWKAQRTDPLGFADDGYWDNAGRKSDAVTSGTFGWDNLNATSTLPIYMARNNNNTGDYLRASNIVPFINTGFTAGATIPGWVLNDSTSTPIAGSRADVVTGSSYNAATGEWIVEMRRKLTNGYTDDVQFDINGTFPFSVAKFDNTGSEHASQGIDVTMYNLKFSTLINSVDLNPGNPASYSLGQNYPNPFNPSTSIDFSIKEKGNVKISLYDVKGELVSVLYNAYTESGTHRLNFTAKNIHTGVYFYRIEAGSFRQTRKMVFLK